MGKIRKVDMTESYQLHKGATSDGVIRENLSEEVARMMRG